MKKIPTLFQREYEDGRVVGVTEEITEGCAEAFLRGDAKVKVDGSCCAIIDGVFYRRYDAKRGKAAPVGAIPCCEPDAVTGHHPHWVRVDEKKPDDKWFVLAYHFTRQSGQLPDGTYEVVGKHFRGNPYDMDYDRLVRHEDTDTVEVERTFDGIRKFLETNELEGLVFWLNGEPVCKIKRSDFGLPWNKPKKEE